MTAINSALQLDLTGAATAESLGKSFYSGIGGQADFMRGAVLAPGGRTILTLPSTAEDGAVSRIVPHLAEGADATLNRGDLRYVVTEYGIAYLHGRNIRERALELIQIAHPRFREWLLEEAKKRKLVYPDQVYIPCQSDAYPEELEIYRTTRTGIELFLRPAKFSDEPLLKDFFASLSEKSLYYRFASPRRNVPREQLRQFCDIDYNRKIVMLALRKERERESEILGLGQFAVNEDAHTAEAAFVVKDEIQNRGIGTVLLEYLTTLAKKQGLLGFTAEVLQENLPMMRVFRKMGFDMTTRNLEGIFELRMMFKE
jgi:RimJ/RimL family protein N-acetyltransferase